MELFTKQVKDRYIRENFERLQQFVDDLVFAQGNFEFFEFRIEGAQEAYKLYHNLGFNPNDVIATKAIGSSFEFVYTEFTDQYITIKTTGDLYLRCIIGNLKGNEVVGKSAFAGVTDDLGSSGGAGGGSYNFLKREATVNASIITDRTIVLQAVPIGGSEVVFLNGLPIGSNGYSINQNIVTIDPSLNITSGDVFIITFAT